jgi:hypothetical protein
MKRRMIRGGLVEGQTEYKPTRAELAATKKSFDWMLAPVRSLRRNPWPLLREPTTYMARVRQKMEEAFKQRIAEVGEERFVRELAGIRVPRRVLLEGFARATDHVREEERAVAVLPAGRGLLGLFGAADARVRNSPLLVFLNLKLILGVNQIAPMGQIHRALEERGEQRARMLLRATADMAEEVYRPYLVEVWNLTEFAEGRVPRRPARFGGLVEQLRRRLDGVEGIVEPLPLRVRNAVDHAHFDYVPSRKSMVLWNKDGWRDEATIDDLKIIAEGLMTVAGTTFPRVAQYFIQDTFLRSGLFSAIMNAIPALQRNDEAALEPTGREIEARTRAMYEEVAHLFATSNGGGEHLVEVAEESRRWLHPDSNGTDGGLRAPAGPPRLNATPRALPPAPVRVDKPRVAR